MIKKTRGIVIFELKKINALHRAIQKLTIEELNLFSCVS